MTLRLPTDVVPDHYNLMLFPLVDGSTFTGKVSITINVTKATRHILVHIRDLAITDKSVSTIGGSPRKLSIVQSFFYKPNEFYVIEVGENLEAGKQYNVTYDFNGNFPKVLFGLYKSTYKTPQGTTRNMVTSDFEPLDARMALPCFDEPTLKATFTTTLVRPTTGYIALSNMPEARSYQYQAGYTAVEYQKTVKMSTYLLAFIICDFKYNETTVNNGVKVSKIRIYSPPHLLNNTGFATYTTKAQMEYFNTQTALPYDLPKSDLIAIPDFNSGAMENWGLITFRETLLLYDPLKSSIFEKQRIAVVISHELVHQWFGNLVTLAWWDDLWLNEGFASYLEYQGVHAVYPDWKIMDQFLSGDFFRIMARDALISSRPISALSDTPAAIKQMFDAITYSKGAVAVRMVEFILGDTGFKNGYRAYLKKYQYSNANTMQLWNSLSEANNNRINMVEVMDPWVRQKNFPVITITNQGAQGTASQKRFLIDDSAATGTGSDFSTYGYKWYVPLNYITSADTNTPISAWLNKTSVNFNYPVNGWMKANVGQYGFYIVNYPETNWNRLQAALESDVNTLKSGDRAGLINDAFMLARSGTIKQSLALGMTKYLSKEKEYVPWTTALGSLGYFDTILSMRPSYGDFKTYMINLIRGRYNDLGWTDTGSHLDRYARSDILLWVTRLNYNTAIQAAKKIYNNWMVNGTSIHPNIRTRVLRAGIAAGGLKEWDFAWNKFLTTESASEKTALMYALAFSRTPWILNRYLQRSMNTSLVRSQDTLSVIRYVSGTTLGRPIAWSFFQANWNTLYDRYSQVTFGLARAAESLTSAFATDYQLQEVQNFFNTAKDTNAISSSKKTILENIKSNIDWLKKNEADVADWLAKNKNI
ncbi:expressed hypothetical protein [Trichoplax adhaerens]|uniref:Aminopeptidase n=1 Tax=Trichoplax adhaerens TaxID=10228 RepID=B3S7T8_TRIAD|nr:expressed hypothetical protein [Trichoplax adhaerens]EDV21351.1 expressed hypothetical protein [Trichoplax adhaerens]|eukprot:XP_002116318.1 expressed hypothetical protein [Trichoplax adhaerens]